MDILNTYAQLPLSENIYLHMCAQCSYHLTKEDTGNGFDILWHSNTRQIVCNYRSTLYKISTHQPLGTTTLRQLFDQLQLSIGHMEIDWSYHLQGNDADFLCNIPIEHLALIHIRLYKVYKD